MTKRVLINRARKIKELEAERTELEKRLEALKDEIKEELTVRGVDETEAGEYTVRYKDITSERFDSKAFKASYSNLYGQFLKTTTTKRFSII